MPTQILTQPKVTCTRTPSLRLQTIIAISFVLAVFITRLPAFFRSVMDHDESLYFLIAGQWRGGHLPYTTIWDNKPPGIYAIFLLFQYAFGDHIWAIRIAAICFVSITAFAVFQIALRIPGPANRQPAACAIFAGFAYIICSLSNDGLAANTEIFMACFTALAMFNALPVERFATKPFARGFVCGLCFGMAFMTKYVAIFEAPAAVFALLFLYPQNTKRRLGFGAMIGAAMPLACVILLYAATGHLQEWWAASIASNFRRVATPVPAGALAYAINLQLSRWLPLYVSGATLAVLTLLQWRHVREPAQRFQIFLLLWLCGGVIGVASAKSFYDHYFLQILPVLCVTMAWVVPRITAPSKLQFPLMAVLLAMPASTAAQALIQAASPILAMKNGHITLQPDTEARIAQEISTVSPPNQVYVFDYQPVIYSLAGQAPPTKYAFPSIITTCFLAHVAGVRATDELRRILAAKPEFIIRNHYPETNPAIINQAVYTMLNQVLAAHYDVWRSYNDAVLYRLRDDNEALDIVPPIVAETCKNAG